MFGGGLVEGNSSSEDLDEAAIVAHARYELGQMLLRGEGGDRDTVGGLKLLRLAAAAGHPNAATARTEALHAFCTTTTK